MATRLATRDLSWLRFNERVLQEAKNLEVPLYERIKFLAIFSSNLDEFFSVRVSALRQFQRIRKSERKSYNIRPNKTLKEIYAEVSRQQEEFGQIINDAIIPELRDLGIVLIGREEFTTNQIDYAIDFFNQKIKDWVNFNWITSNENPLFLVNNNIYLVARTTDNRIGIANVPVSDIGRFIQLPNEENLAYYTFLEDIIALAIRNQLKDEGIEEIISIKMSRDAETYIEDEFSGDLIEKIKKAIEERGEGLPTRLLYDKNISEILLKKIQRIYGLGKSDMIEGGRYHNFIDFFNFPQPPGRPDLNYEEMAPLPHRRLDQADSLLHHIQNHDEILHFPYQSFNYIPTLLLEAANSKEVLHLKMTLYRISDTSAVAKALLYALECGKKVTVFIEAKARFDEANNLAWGKRLEEAGAHVIYSYPVIKIHSKIIVINMVKSSSLKDVVYVGTGNFNEKTSRIYCDHGLLTSHENLAEELDQVFQVLSGALIMPKAKHLVVSPFTTRKTFDDLIEYEINQKRSGKKAWIKIKMNSLEDPHMIRKLYKASQAGVQVKLIVRGFCCLVPGVEGLSENIRVTSIVDRFLEHARIYNFAHGGKERMYIGSADWMTRNLDRRIEVCTPIYNTRILNELKHILEIQLNDNVKARIIDEQQSNQFVIPKPREPRVRAQFATYDYLKSLDA
jgi:polyphosphate kinase